MQDFQVSNTQQSKLTHSLRLAQVQAPPRTLPHPHQYLHLSLNSCKTSY